MLRRQLRFALSGTVAPMPQKAGTTTGFEEFFATVNAITQQQSPHVQRAIASSLWTSMEVKDRRLEEKDILLEEKDKRLEEKDKYLDKHLVEKDRLLEEKDKRLEEKDRRFLELESKLLALQAKVSSVYSFRPIIELACKRLYNKKQLSANVSTFIAEHLQPDGTTLSSESQTTLKQFNLDHNARNEVGLFVSQLYYKLSEPFHTVPDEKHPTGFVLGGPEPLRYATALVLLKLQQVPGGDIVPSEVFILDNQNKVSHVLRDGVVEQQ